MRVLNEQRVGKGNISGRMSKCKNKTSEKTERLHKIYENKIIRTGDDVTIDGVKFIDITEYIGAPAGKAVLLYNGEPIYHRFGRASNNYKTSEIYRYLQSGKFARDTGIKIDYDSIDLLSVEEAEKLPINVRKYGYYWWLRSPGRNFDWAANVKSDGSFRLFGDEVDYNYYVVRPALVVNQELLNQKEPKSKYSEKELHNNKDYKDYEYAHSSTLGSYDNCYSDYVESFMRNRRRNKVRESVNYRKVRNSINVVRPALVVDIESANQEHPSKNESVNQHNVSKFVRNLSRKLAFKTFTLELCGVGSEYEDDEYVIIENATPSKVINASRKEDERVMYSAGDYYFLLTDDQTGYQQLFYSTDDIIDYFETNDLLEESVNHNKKIKKARSSRNNCHGKSCNESIDIWDNSIEYTDSDRFDLATWLIDYYPQYFENMEHADIERKLLYLDGEKIDSRCPIIFTLIDEDDDYFTEAVDTPFDKKSKKEQEEENKKKRGSLIPPNKTFIDRKKEFNKKSCRGSNCYESMRASTDDNKWFWK